MTRTTPRLASLFAGLLAAGLAAGCAVDAGDELDTLDPELTVTTGDDVAGLKSCSGRAPNLTVEVTVYRDGAPITHCATPPDWLSVTVRNLGCGTAAASTLHLTSHGDLEVPALAGFASATYRLRYSPQDEFAGHAIADATEVVAESDETDNLGVWACLR